MPLYEYTCEACGARFELIRKFSDPPLESCTVCAGGPVHRLPSSPAIQFKGSGFYITDYARKGDGKETGDRRQEAGGGKPDKASTEKAQDAKSDAAAAERGADKGTEKGADSAAKPAATTAAKADTAAKSDAPAKPAPTSSSGSSSSTGGSKD